MKPIPELKKGDLVRWSSQSRGQSRHHVGVVVLVVPAGMPIQLVTDRLGDRYSLRAMHRAHGPRAELSYLVVRTDVRSGGRARLHWPHASLLRPYDAPAP